MKKKISWEITFLLTLFLFICLIGAYATNLFFKNQVISQQEQHLERETAVLEQTTDVQTIFEKGTITAEQIARLKTFVANTGERVTLLTSNGEIIFDTTTIKNKARKNRPEIIAVKTGAKVGRDLRKSATLKEELLYVAIPYEKKGKLLGIIRISEKYAGFSGNIRKFQLLLFSFIALLIVGLFVLTLVIVRQRNRPLRTVLPVLRNVLAHPEKQNSITQEAFEWEELYKTVNQLAKEMNRTYLANSSNEEKLNYLLNDLQIGIFSIDPHQHFSMMNPKAKEMLAVSDDSPIDVPYLELIQQPQILRIIQKVLLNKTDIHEEVQLIQPQEKYFDMQLKYIESQQDQSIQLLGIAYDITEIKQLENMQQDFVSNVSHELKTPVTSLIGFTETLLDGAKNDPETLTEFLTIMQNDALRLEQLIKEILLLSRTANHIQPESLSICSPAKLIQDLLTDYTSKIQEKKLQIKLDLDATQTIETYVYLLKPILKNLIENAIQYNQIGGQIQIQLEFRYDVLKVSIADTGIGISEIDQERIFERFYRADKARTRNSGGTGLGLSIAAHYTKLLHGQLKLTSHLGIGTKFILSLPIVQNKNK